MTGGAFSLVGGFWAGVSGPSICRGDLDCDGQVDFADINPFVTCLSTHTLPIPCVPGPGGCDAP